MSRTPARATQAEGAVTHFVGFRGKEYWSAVRIWGRPGFIHRRWDRRAARDIGPEDTIIFAVGNEGSPPAERNGDDIDERWLPGGELYG